MAKIIKRAKFQLVTSRGVIAPGARIKFRLPKKEMEELEKYGGLYEEQIDDDLIRDKGDADPDADSSDDENPGSDDEQSGE